MKVSGLKREPILPLRIYAVQSGRTFKSCGYTTHFVQNTVLEVDLDTPWNIADCSARASLIDFVKVGASLQMLSDKTVAEARLEYR